MNKKFSKLISVLMSLLLATSSYSPLVSVTFATLSPPSSSDLRSRTTIEIPDSPTSDELRGTEEESDSSGSTEEPTSDNTGTDTTTDVSADSTGATEASGDQTTSEVTPDPLSTDTSLLDPESTGAQTQDNSVGDVEIDTGDGTNNATISNIGDSNLALGDGGSGGGLGDISVINSGNGTDSTNGADVTTLNDIVLIQSNLSDITNDINLDTTTGDNSASANVGDASITTGDAAVTATVVNSVNTNVEGAMISEFNILDNQTGDYVLDFNAGCIAGCGGGDLLAKNSGNGSDSTNQIGIDQVDSQATFQYNDATLENNLTLSADSGSNTADNNTGGDVSIDTGDADVAASVFNFANNNFAGNVYFTTVNIFGTLDGDIVMPDEFFTACDCGAGATDLTNTQNGTGSNNAIAYTTADSTNLFQTNDAMINNNLILDATTGENSASDNTGGNVDITTGDTDVQASILNIANTNLIGGNWWLVLVNNAGQWLGKIYGSPDGSVIGGSAGTEFGFNQNGELTAINTGNGAYSDNNIDVNQANSNSITQDNKAEINNNLNLSANTGNNSASRNTGGDAKITTGDANINANIINFINNNIIGSGKLFVTVINVFGNWFGDFVPASQKTQELALAADTDSGAQNDNPSDSEDGDQDQSQNSEAGDSNDSGSADDNNAQAAGVTGEGNFENPQQADANQNTFQNNKVGKLLASVIPNAEAVSSESPSAPTKMTVSINLAWGLLLIPLFFLIKYRRLLRG